MVKNPPANAGDVRDEGSISRSGRSPGGGQVTVHGGRKESDSTQRLSTHSEYIMVKKIYTHRYIKQYLTMQINSP